MAQSGQIEPSPVCPLLGAKRTLPLSAVSSAYDPKRTKAELKSRSAAGSSVALKGSPVCDHSLASTVSCSWPHAKRAVWPQRQIFGSDEQVCGLWAQQLTSVPNNDAKRRGPNSPLALLMPTGPRLEWLGHFPFGDAWARQ